jgi:hypothetical protein
VAGVIRTLRFPDRRRADGADLSGPSRVRRQSRSSTFGKAQAGAARVAWLMPVREATAQVRQAPLNVPEFAQRHCQTREPQPFGCHLARSDGSLRPPPQVSEKTAKAGRLLLLVGPFGLGADVPETLMAALGGKRTLSRPSAGLSHWPAGPGLIIAPATLPSALSTIATIIAPFANEARYSSPPIMPTSSNLIERNSPSGKTSPVSLAAARG